MISTISNPRRNWKALSPEGRELTRFCKLARVEPLRSIREFAESEIIIPDGPYRGRKFSCRRQPYSGLWFDLIDLGLWQRYFACGPTQSGKSLCGFVIPAMYHLFEIQETVICGLPSMDVAGDKWREDFLPVIEASRYKDLLPSQGAGSRGGNPTAIKFRNGMTMKFMSGGGDDKKRASFTSRILVVTEVDGLDKADESSREADKMTQMEARTNAFGDRQRIYGECTVSIESGRIWTEYTSGTKSRICLPCPKCGDYVTPEREHFLGWQDAENEMEAKQNAHFCCPGCAEPWTAEERKLANEAAIVLHDGQTVVATPAGPEISGTPRATQTLGFRWSAVNNLFQTPGLIGVKEFKASRSEDEENSEKELQQFYWTVPHKPEKTELMPIDIQAIYRRVIPLAQKVVPEKTKWITVGADLGKYLIHWCAVAWQEDATGHILDYGRQEVPSQELGIEQGILNALRQLRTKLEEGYGGHLVDQVFIDSGWQDAQAIAFCRDAECGGKYRPSKGFGTTQYRRGFSEKSFESNKNIRWVGQRFHIAWVPTARANLVEIDVDHWKSFVHARISVPINGSGALTLFDEPSRLNHLAFAKHLTAERQVEEFVEGRGGVIRWEVIRENNHWLDALTMAAAAGYLMGMRVGGVKPTVKKAEEQKPSLTTPDGRPYLVTERN